MSSIQENTFNVIVDYYNKTNDLKKVFDVCTEMVRSPSSEAVIRGELAEAILYLMLKDFIDRNNLKDWRISKGIVIGNSDLHSDYSTELDLTLFTPKCIYAFECKSYKGPKYLTNKGTLMVKRGGGDNYKVAMDVYSQHDKHFKALMKNISVAQDKSVFHDKYRSYKLLYFDFADVPTRDKRSRQDRGVFPIITCKNIYKLFNNYYERPDYWNMDILNKVVDSIEENGKAKRKVHIDFVTSIHGSKR